MADPTAYCPGCGSTRCTCAADEKREAQAECVSIADDLAAIAERIEHVVSVLRVDIDTPGLSALIASMKEASRDY